MTHLLILGAGFSGKAIGQAFTAAGFSVSGTTRSTEKAEGLRALGIAPILYDGGPVPEAEAAPVPAGFRRFGFFQSVRQGPRRHRHQSVRGGPVHCRIQLVRLSMA